MPRASMWSQDDRARVAALLLAGRSMGAIARSLGLERGVVIGRVSRDGSLHAYAGKIVINKAVARRAGEPTPADAVVLAVGKPLRDLGNRECHWPLAEVADVVGGFLFCSEAVEHDTGCYCAAHRQVARAS